MKFGRASRGAAPRTSSSASRVVAGDQLVEDPARLRVDEEHARAVLQLSSALKMARSSDCQPSAASDQKLLERRQPRRTIASISGPCRSQSVMCHVERGVIDAEALGLAAPTRPGRHRRGTACRRDGEVDDSRDPAASGSPGAGPPVVARDGAAEGQLGGGRGRRAPGRTYFRRVEGRERRRGRRRGRWADGDDPLAADGDVGGWNLRAGPSCPRRRIKSAAMVTTCAWCPGSEDWGAPAENRRKVESDGSATRPCAGEVRRQPVAASETLQLRQSTTESHRVSTRASEIVALSDSRRASALLTHRLLVAPGGWDTTARAPPGADDALSQHGGAHERCRNANE